MSPLATISNIADHGAKVRRQSWTLHVDPVGDLYESALDCERAVFLQAYGNTVDELNTEYGPYDESSFLISVTDESGYTVGVCRIITPGAFGTKTLNDINASPWFADSARLARACGIDAGKTWDIATLGVRAEYRTQAPMVTMALLHAMVATTRANGIPAVTAMLDERARRNGLGPPLHRARAARPGRQRRGHAARRLHEPPRRLRQGLPRHCARAPRPRRRRQRRSQRWCDGAHPGELLGAH